MIAWVVVQRTKISLWKNHIMLESQKQQDKLTLSQNIKEENTGNMSLGATSVIPGVWVAERAVFITLQSRNDGFHRGCLARAPVICGS